jgi:hypothetical protein
MVVRTASPRALHRDMLSPEASANIVRHRRRHHRRQACSMGERGPIVEFVEVEGKPVTPWGR